MQREQRNLPSRRYQPFDLGIRDSALSWGASPWQVMRRMQEDMDRMFSQYVSSDLSSSQATLSPSMDISETDGALRIEVDLPGFKQDDISVEMRDNRLAISAEMRKDEEPSDARYHRRERHYGRFEQVLTLPQNIDPEKITARFTDGVLTLEVPKTDRTLNAGRRIAIQGVQSPTPMPARSSDHQAERGDTRAGTPLASPSPEGDQDVANA